MVENNIKKYILEHKNNYSKEQIIQALISAGYKIEDINQVYLQLSNQETQNNSKCKKKMSTTKIIFIVVLLIICLPILLICVALIFSFVNFGSLLPDIVDISTQSVRGDAVNSAAYSSASSLNQNKVYISFIYTGSQKGSINSQDTTLTDLDGDTCTPIEISNDITMEGEENLDINLLYGQPGMITFDCSNLNLKEGEQFEGEILIGILESNRPNSIPNKGTIRLTIQ
jgi:hypothetical protein